MAQQKKTAKKATKKTAAKKKEAADRDAELGCCTIIIAGNRSSKGNITRKKCQEDAESFPGATFDWKPGPCSRSNIKLSPHHTPAK